VAVDRKYGRVTLERGTIGKDERVFVLRAQDRLSVALLRIYAVICRLSGSPDRHVEGVQDAIYDFEHWQSENPTQIPQSAPQ